ncbi:MAG: hypothetical protein HPKKFMNG_00523 [Planctomycetes bacterium]|nr:hypothetical protein [Planctomycetota bacterium]
MLPVPNVPAAVALRNWMPAGVLVRARVTLPEAGVRLLPLTVKLAAVPAVPAVVAGTVIVPVGLTVRVGVDVPLDVPRTPIE